MISERLHDEVETHVPIGEARAASMHAIWTAVDCWSPVTIKHVIRALRRRGRVVAIGEGVSRRFYRVPQ